MRQPLAYLQRPGDSARAADTNHNRIQPPAHKWTVADRRDWALLLGIQTVSAEAHCSQAVVNCRCAAVCRGVARGGIGALRLCCKERVSWAAQLFGGASSQYL